MSKLGTRCRAMFAGLSAVAFLTSCGGTTTDTGANGAGGATVDAMGGRAGGASPAGNGGGQAGTGVDANGGNQAGTIGCGTVASDPSRITPSVMAGAPPDPEGGTLV